MNSLLPEGFAKFAIDNPYSYNLLCQNALLSGQFQLNSILTPAAILVLTKKHILLQLRLDNQSPLFYAIDLNETLTYRILGWKQGYSQNDSWQLLLTHHMHTLALRANGTTSVEVWDSFLRKTVTKEGFHEDFKPIRRMGVGTSATVYEVARKRDNRRFAVKAFTKSNINKQPKRKQALLNEIKILRILSQESHQNVLNLYQIYESQNTVYLVLDLCSGVLSKRLAQSLETMSEQNKKHIIVQLLRGLTHIHSKNIAHRDIKLENILLLNKKHETQLIIGDFGLSTLIQQENYLFTACGTPGFVAPEIVNAKPNQKLSNPNCDVFAIGVIFHYLLTGRPLFQGNSLMEIYQSNKKLDFDLNHQRYTSLNHKALDLLKGMLKISHNQRLTSEEALKHQYFAQEDSYKLQSPATTLQTTSNFQSDIELPQLKIEGIQPRKQGHWKAS